jgi:transposase InsO family protein
LFGKTRHAYYDHQWRHKGDNFKEEIILDQVREIRKTLQKAGIRQLMVNLKPVLASHGIKIGRDALNDLLREHKLLIRQRKRKAFTTDSRHWMRKYANLIRDMVIDRPEQVWVSDITYIAMPDGWGYLSLITDLYSHKIVGYCFRMDLLAIGCLEALQMAFDHRSYGDLFLIHHSDRGSQYCCKAYIDLLTSLGVAISMTEKKDPYENPVAERANGILKEEFNLYSSKVGFDQTYEHIIKSISAYNEVRPHSSCDYLTPEMAHQQTGKLKKRWKNYYRKSPGKPAPL